MIEPITVPMTIESSESSIGMNISSDAGTINMGFSVQIAPVRTVMTVNRLGVAYAIIDPNYEGE